MNDLSVGRSVRTSVCPVHCGKTADWIRQPFGIVGRTGLGMRQVVGFGDQSKGRGTFGVESGAPHCNRWGLYGVGLRVQQRRDAALFPNYLVQSADLFSFLIVLLFLLLLCLIAPRVRNK